MVKLIALQRVHVCFMRNEKNDFVQQLYGKPNFLSNSSQIARQLFIHSNKTIYWLTVYQRKEPHYRLILAQVPGPHKRGVCVSTYCIISYHQNYMFHNPTKSFTYSLTVKNIKSLSCLGPLTMVDQRLSVTLRNRTTLFRKCVINEREMMKPGHGLPETLDFRQLTHHLAG